MLATNLPAEGEMWADKAGMEQSRKTLASQREIAARDEYAPETITVSHGLQLVVVEDEEAEGQESPE